MDAVNFNSIPLYGNIQEKHNRFCALNPSELASSENRAKTGYKVAAYLALGIGIALLVGTVAFVAVTFSLYLSPFLIAAGATAAVAASLTPGLASAGAAITFIAAMVLYDRVVKNGFFKHFKDQEIEKQSLAEMHSGYAESIEAVKTKFPDMPKYQQNLLGIATYWEERAKSTKTKIKALDSQILQLEEAGESFQVSKLRQERHDLREGDLLQSKIHAAYFYYLVENPTEFREVNDFVSLSPISLLAANSHSQINKQRTKLPGIETIKKAPYAKHLSRKFIRNNSTEIIKQQLFVFKPQLAPEKQNSDPKVDVSVTLKKYQAPTLQEKHPDFANNPNDGKDYWEKKTREAQTAIKELDTAIFALDKEIFRSSSPSQKDMQDLYSLREIRHRFREGDLLQAKIHTAYYKHLFLNPSDKRKLEDFVTFSPISLLEADNHRQLKRLRRKSRGIKTIEKAPYAAHLSRKDIRRDSIKILERQIFRQKAS